jgi:uncharacterized cysteine cluster protein YcgN (CxxCxxCC family)
VSGDPDTVHTAGVSVKGRTRNEDSMTIEDFEDYVVAWPGEIPAKARGKARK